LQDVKNLFVVAGAKYHLYTSSFLIFFLYSQLQPLTRWKHAFDSAIFFSSLSSSYREERTFMDGGFLYKCNVLQSLFTRFIAPQTDFAACKNSNVSFLRFIFFNLSSNLPLFALGIVVESPQSYETK
jgi:hypothetical protein